MLGLVRHMTQMEHVYLAWGLGGGERVEVYGDNDYAGGSAVDDVDNVSCWVRLHTGELPSCGPPTVGFTTLISSSPTRTAGLGRRGQA